MPSTAEDRTEYHELIAADRLELAARIEADRMENSKFDPTELAHEMTVVRSELEGDGNSPRLRSVYQHVPAGGVLRRTRTTGRSSAGAPMSKRSPSRRDVIYDYYKKHYMPNNAVVVMVGDFDTKKAVGDLSRNTSASIPPGTLDTHYITPGAAPARRAARHPQAARHDRRRC